MRWWQIESVMGIESDLFAGDQWSAAMFWSELAERATRHYLVATGSLATDAEADAAIVGYAGLCVYGSEAYIQTVGVRRDRQRTGVGRALLLALLAEGDRRAVRTVALEVRADNVAAQRLYANHGFEPVGLRRGYYQPSGADAVVMLRRIPAAVPDYRRRAGG